MTEYNDIYDRDRNLTGRVHRRGSRWNKDEYGLVVCVWVYDGKGKVLLTRRAPQKSAPGTWENSGGAAKAGEDSLSAIVRELREETGIVASPEEFELLDSCTERGTHGSFLRSLGDALFCPCVLLPPGRFPLSDLVFFVSGSGGGSLDGAFSWVTSGSCAPSRTASSMTMFLIRLSSFCCESGRRSGRWSP